MTVEFALGGLGDVEEGSLGANLPLLAGEPIELLMPNAVAGPRHGDVRTWAGPDGIVGFARVGLEEGLERATHTTYSDIIRATRGLHLYRLWNFVPGINSTGPEGIENYQSFCRARSLAFESGLGPGFARLLPAASAVGSEAPELTVVFLAGPGSVRHFENPVQLPAYEYPREHGPRPPSFSRASIVSSRATLDAFISGTSSVVGHETVAPHQTSLQLACTFDNLRRISRSCGLGEDLGADSAGRRHFKVYIRNAGELGLVATAMRAEGFLSGSDRVTYLRADICRAALNVEIEVTVRGVPRS